MIFLVVVSVFFPNPAFKMRDIALKESHQAPYLGFAVPSNLTLPPLFILGGLLTSVKAGFDLAIAGILRPPCSLLVPLPLLPLSFCFSQASSPSDHGNDLALE